MKSNSLWTRDFQSVVDNGRNHSLVIDLPEPKGGSNSGPTALELCVMSLSGCVGTIFSMMAQKMRLIYETMEVEVVAEQKNNAPTITDVNLVLMIQTQDSKEKVDKCLQHTINTCPVGLLYKQAGVTITSEIKMMGL